MIEVTRLNGTPMTLNSDLIKIAESSPDTMLTLIHGEKLIVRESRAEVVEKILAYRARLLTVIASAAGPAPDLHRVVAMTSLSPDSAHESTPQTPVKVFPALKLEPGGKQPGASIG